MEIYKTEDGNVVKYVHNDGSETAIKTVSSCDNIYNEATGKVEPVNVDRNKFSVFISTSVGCLIGCKFCYLTVKKFPYHKLTPVEIERNVINALKDRIQYDLTGVPHIDDYFKDKYMKLSWMGMGDALIYRPEYILDVTQNILNYSIEYGLVAGIDGVDISTVLPRKMLKKGWPFYYGMLNMILRNSYFINPKSRNRSPLRLFYSLHHPDLINVKRNLHHDFETLRRFNYDYGVDIIIHHMFIEGFTDTIEHLDHLKLFFDQYGFHPELRILRYNECDNSPYKEAPNFNELVKHAAHIFPKIKYQVSAGSEIKAACGQFLCKNLKEND